MSSRLKSFVDYMEMAGMRDNDFVTIKAVTLSIDIDLTVKFSELKELTDKE